MPVSYRRMDERDFTFVVDSWARSYRDSDHAGLIQNSDWFSVMIGQLGKVLARPEVETIVAYDAGTDRIADIYGWLCCEPLRIPPLVLFVFVKSAYRKRGIAAGLFRHARIRLERPWHYACRTYVVDELEDKHWLQRNAPYATFRPREGRH